VKRVGRQLAAAIVIALGGLAALHGVAEANPCRFLDMKIMQLQGSGASAGEIKAVRNMKAMRGCGGRRRAAAPKPDFWRGEPRREKRILRRAARPEKARPQRRERAVARAPEEKRRVSKPPQMSVPAGTYRTWCVRSCDGYYFPVSFSTTRDRFAADEEACREMCPAAEPRLFAHAAKGETPQDMVALDGTAYASLPVAFKYREALDQSCSCGGAPVDVALTSAARGKGPAQQAALLPRPRPEPGEDPETLANRDGAFEPGPAEPVATGAIGPSVRVVWPDWQSEQAELLITAVPN